MHEPIYLKKFRQISTRFIKSIKLDKIDSHESLTFLHRNFNVHPSEVITMAVFFILFIILMLDGFNFIASVVCFLLPLVDCLAKIGGVESKKSMNFINSQAS